MKRMMRHLTGRRLDRRTFLRFGAAGGAALAAGSLLRLGPRRTAAQGQGDRKSVV
jgi:hypothetical protein